MPSRHREGWSARWTDHEGKRRRTTFRFKRDAEAYERKMKGEQEEISVVVPDDVDQDARKRWVDIPGGILGETTVSYVQADVEQETARDTRLRLVLVDVGKPGGDTENDPGFNVQVQVPPGFVKTKDTPITTIYEAPDKSALLNVGHGLIGNDPKQSLIGKCEDLMRPSPGMSVVYKKKGGTWCVATGYVGGDKGKIYYTKYVVAGGRWAQFTIFFDSDQKPTYAPLIGPMQKTFHIVTQ